MREALEESTCHWAKQTMCKGMNEVATQRDECWPNERAGHHHDPTYPNNQSLGVGGAPGCNLGQGRAIT